MTTTEPAFEPGTYRITFDRIGRSRPPAFTADVASGPDLADAVFKYARPHVMSSGLDVDVRFDGTGYLTVGGCRNAGDFTWERVAAATQGGQP